MDDLQGRLQEILQAKGWDHADLVEASGESSSVVSQWLGKTSTPTKSIGRWETAIRLEQRTGYAALWIARGRGPKLRSSDGNLLVEWPFSVPYERYQDLPDEVQGMLRGMFEGALTGYWNAAEAKKAKRKQKPSKQARAAA